jgi:hypothetical protein
MDRDYRALSTGKDLFFDVTFGVAVKVDTDDFRHMTHIMGRQQLRRLPLSQKQKDRSSKARFEPGSYPILQVYLKKELENEHFSDGF